MALLPWCLGSGRVAYIAQVPDFQQPLIQGFDENGRAGPGVLPKTRHAEDDVVWLRVVTGAVAVGHHWAVAAEHLHGGGDLDRRARVQTGSDWGKGSRECKMRIKWRKNKTALLEHLAHKQSHVPGARIMLKSVLFFFVQVPTQSKRLLLQSRITEKPFFFFFISLAVGVIFFDKDTK